MWIFFLMEKKSSPPVPATNQRWWALITNGLWTGGDVPSYHCRFWNRRWWPPYHHRLKSNAPPNRRWCSFRTGGDRGAGVVMVSRSRPEHVKNIRFMPFFFVLRKGSCHLTVMSFPKNLTVMWHSMPGLTSSDGYPFSSYIFADHFAN